MKLCKDCKHAQKDDESYRFARCNAPQNMKLDLVSGRQIRNCEYCGTLRNSTYDCGLDAKWFEIKPMQEFVKTRIPLSKRIFRTQYWEPK